MNAIMVHGKVILEMIYFILNYKDTFGVIV